MRMVKVPLGERSYSILIGEGLLPRLGAECNHLGLGRNCAIISDVNVAPAFGQAASRSLAKAGFEPFLITVPAGQTAKKFKNLQACYDRLAGPRFERRSFNLALGGGSVADVCG